MPPTTSLPTDVPDHLGHLRRDRALVDAGTKGERRVARSRILLLCLLLLIQVVPSSDAFDNFVGFSLNLLALVIAIGIYFLATYHYKPWLPFVSSAIDVNLVSLGLVGFFMFGKPETAVNSKVVFEAYFLAIGCASLRFDWRVCAMTGALAIAEYMAIVTYAWNHFESFGAVGADSAFGWNIQAGRLIMLSAATVISVAAVLRTQQLRRLSTTDRLTGLHNRGFLEDQLAAEENRARRYGRPFSVALLDVDHFKRFNDTHGHAAGDKALVLLADMLRASVRRSDVVARYGGEEFALMLPETGIEEAAGKLELIRRLVAATQIEVGSAKLVRIDVSAGVASFPKDGEAGHAVLAAADACLYQAKRAGRGRVVATTA